MEKAIVLSDFIQAALETGLAETRVSLPGIIQNFDADTQLADVQPCLGDTIVADGVRTDYTLPVITDVPVIFYGTDTWAVTGPVVAGTECLLSFVDRSMDDWITSGRVGNPPALYRHNLSDAVAHLGLRSQSKRLRVFDTSKITIGRSAGNTFALALATLVKQEIDKVVSAFNNHTHTVPDGTSGAPIVPMSNCSDVGSSYVQTRE